MHPPCDPPSVPGCYSRVQLAMPSVAQTVGENSSYALTGGSVDLPAAVHGLVEIQQDCLSLGETERKAATKTHTSSCHEPCVLNRPVRREPDSSLATDDLYLALSDTHRGMLSVCASSLQESEARLLQQGSGVGDGRHRTGSLCCAYHALNNKQLERAVLMLAIYQRDTQLIRRMLETGIGLSAIGREALSPLHVAAWVGHSRIVTLLLRAGAKIDEPTQGG